MISYWGSHVVSECRHIVKKVPGDPVLGEFILKLAYIRREELGSFSGSQMMGFQLSNADLIVNTNGKKQKMMFKDTNDTTNTR